MARPATPRRADLRVFGNPQATAPTTLDGRGSGRVLTVLPSLLSSVTVTLTRLVVIGGGEGGIEVGEGTTVVSGNVPDDCAC